MVSFLTRVAVADNCGARVAQCIKLLVGAKPRRACPGKLVIVVVKRADPLKKKISIGMISRALVIRTSFAFFRGFGVWLSFNQNAVVLTNKRAAPYGKRLRGPFLKEVCLKYNFLGTVTRFII